MVKYFIKYTNYVQINHEKNKLCEKKNKKLNKEKPKHKINK